MSEENKNRKVSEEEAELWAGTQVGIPIERARAYIALSHLSFDKDKYKDSLLLSETALDLIEAEAEIDYAPELAHLLSGIAQCLYYLARYEDEVVILEKALRVVRQTGCGNEPDLLRQQGRAYHALKDDENSIRCHQAALEYPDPDLTENTIAIDHLNVGMSLGRLKRSDEAVKRLLIARDLFKQQKDPRGVAICDGELTEIYVEENDGVNAQRYGELALGTADILEDRHRQWWLNYFLGVAKHIQGDLDEALTYLETGRGLALAHGFEEFLYLAKVDQEISNIYLKRGMIKQAEEIQRRVANVKEILGAA